MELAPGSAVPEMQIRSAAGVEDVTVVDHVVTCTVRGSFEPLLEAIRDAHVINMVSTEPSLEEVFLSYYSEGPEPKALPS